MHLRESASGLAEPGNEGDSGIQATGTAGTAEEAQHVQRLGHVACLENNKKCKREGQQEVTEDERNAPNSTA